jgi:rSAM/selenodomain-associated transferase 2
MNKLSIILPVLNEAALIGTALQALQDVRQRGAELVVVDGGSSDDTVQLATALADRVVVAGAGRARQMNGGAELASGERLLFLHLDSELPEGAMEFIEQQCGSTANHWGWFDVRLSHPGFAYRVIARFMNLRARLSRVCTGDQALFLSRPLFEQVGGFPELPLMEDVAMSKRLRQLSPPVVCKQPVIASSRRWEEKGLLNTVLLMWKLRLLYFFGVSPDRLVTLYYPE